MRPRDELVGRLEALDTCAVSDALDTLGLEGVAAGITPLGPCRPVVGRAVTVELTDGRAPQSAGHLATAAIEASEPGAVIVVAHGGAADVAGWGGNLHLAAGLRGVAGVVVDGAVRDAAEIAGNPPPVFCRGVTPKSARGRVFQRAWNEQIRIAGVAVTPTDLVIADASGVVVVTAALAPTVIAKAEEISARDEQRAKRIGRGTPVSEVMGASYERQLDPSAAR